jgi:hypothetical protein
MNIGRLVNTEFINIRRPHRKSNFLTNLPVSFQNNLLWISIKTLFFNLWKNGYSWISKRELASCLASKKVCVLVFYLFSLARKKLHSYDSWFLILAVVQKYIVFFSYWVPFLYHLHIVIWRPPPPQLDEVIMGENFISGPLHQLHTIILSIKVFVFMCSLIVHQAWSPKIYCMSTKVFFYLNG